MFVAVSSCKGKTARVRKSDPPGSEAIDEIQRVLATVANEASWEATIPHDFSSAIGQVNADAE